VKGGIRHFWVPLGWFFGFLAVAVREILLAIRQLRREKVRRQAG
jgi:hypothetical protein